MKKAFTKTEFNHLRSDGMAMWKWLSNHLDKGKGNYIHIHLKACFYAEKHYPILSARYLRMIRYIVQCPFCTLFYATSDYADTCKNCPLNKRFAKESGISVIERAACCAIGQPYSIWEHKLTYNPEERKQACLDIVEEFRNWKWSDIPEEYKK